jgi:hypothetical protein
MAINLGIFKGALPKIDPRLLPDENAQLATNCRFDSGSIEALNAPLLLSTTVPAYAKTLHKYVNGNTVAWLSWDKNVDVVGSQVINDKHGRVYLTGDGVPKFIPEELAVGSGNKHPKGTIPLGIPAPAHPPTLSSIAKSKEVDDVTDDETRFYVYTWVTEFGEESAPSPPSASILVEKPTSWVTINLPALAVNDRRIQYRRIYRTATAGGTTEFFYVGEALATTTKYTDTVAAESLGTTLATLDHFPPPDDMQGLTGLANGVMIGFVGKTIYPSEPYLPYAYSPSNQLSVDYDIVGMAAVQNGAIICTTGQPYLLQGFTPDSFQLVKLESNAPCVSALSIVDLGTVVVYAGHDGLYAVSSGEPQNITEKVMSSQQWRDFNPQSIRGFQYDGKYFAVSDAGCKVFDLRDPDVITVDFDATAGFYDLESGELIYCNSSGVMYSFDRGLASDGFTWRSKEFRSTPKSFSACKVHGRDLVVTLYKDGAVFHIDNHSSGERVFRLPPGIGSRWELNITGQKLESVSVAGAVGDLM